MGLCVSLHVNDTQLDVGFWEEALGDGEEPREVVLDHEEHAAEPSLDEVAQDGLPVLEVLPTEFADAGQHSLLPIATKPDNQVDGGGSESISVPDLDVLTIDEKGQEVRVHGAGVFLD
jgi:hypothetical protein